MDLSFPLNDSMRPTVRAGGMAAVLAMTDRRQAGSATATIARDLTPRHATNPWLAPKGGAFGAATAAALTRWKQL